MLHELHALVEAALADTHDLEDAWLRLGDAIDAAPEDASLRRLRARLAEAAVLPVQRLADLRVLHRLQPDDRDAALALACLQHRWAHRLAPGADRAGPEAAAAAARLQDDAVQHLAALVQAHAADAGYMATLFDNWAAHGLERPWTRLRLVTQALAAHPADRRLRTHLAQVWVALAGQAPSLPGPAGSAPVGFAVDAFGGLQDALITRRALAALDELIADDPEAAPLLEARARLGLGCSHFDSAAQDFRAAAILFSEQAVQADSAGQREALQARAEEAARQARRCAGGREACITAWMQDRHGAPGQPAPAAATNPGGLARQLAALLPQAPLSAQAPDSGTLARLRSTAGALAEQVAAAAAFAPSPWQLRGAAMPAPDAALRQLDAQLRALGLLHLAWAFDPAGAPTGVWTSAEGDVALCAWADCARECLEAQTELSSGLQIVTTANRGRHYLEGGPMVDHLRVDGDLGLAELLALHRARLALALSQTPELRVRHARNAGDFVAQQERQRLARAAWRLQTGLSEFEALALPAEQPEHFVPLVREAARAAVARAHAEYRRRLHA